MHRYRLLLILALIFPIASYAQGFEVYRQAPPSAGASGASGFTALEGRFTIALPKEVSSYQPVSNKTPAGTVTGEIYTWIVAEGMFKLIYIDRLETLTDATAINSLLDSVRDQTLAQMVKAKGKLIRENSISLSSYSGRELKIEAPEGLYTARLYVVRERLYELLCLQSQSQQAKELEALKILDSFKLLTTDEVEAARRKIIADSTPAPLPQEPMAKRPKSDAEDDNLKGKVKCIVTESEDLSGTWTGGRRKPSATVYYNEQGNMTKGESYDHRGNLWSITVYGYLDGDRVLKTNYIRHYYNPPPMMDPPTAAQARLKRDSRYSVKYKYKYDDKRNLLEKEAYGNNGQVSLRYVYHLKTPQLEKLVYSANGSLDQKYLFTLDGNGQVIEEVDYEPKDGSIRSKYAYKYEVDAKGNWIKKTTERWVTKDGKSGYEPAGVTYRTITYY